MNCSRPSKFRSGDQWKLILAQAVSLDELLSKMANAWRQYSCDGKPQFADAKSDKTPFFASLSGGMCIGSFFNFAALLKTLFR